jgi:hypothetical protein
MIDFRDESIVRRCRLPDGRFLFFLDADLPAGSALPWWAVAADIGGDGLIFLLTPEGREDGWSAADFLRIAGARAGAEAGISGDGGLARLGRALDATAILASGLWPGSAVPALIFRQKEAIARLSWTTACRGEVCLPFAPDPAVPADGLTLAQALAVLRQLAEDLKPETAMDSREAHLARAIRHALSLAPAVLRAGARGRS